MIHTLTDALSVIGRATGPAFIVKATCILLVAFVALAVTSHARAATRHAIVVCTFVALLALPAVLWLSPGFTVSVAAERKPLAVVLPSQATTSALTGVSAEASRRHVTPVNVRDALTARTPLSTAEMLVAVWMMGALLTFTPFALGLYQMRRLRRTSMPWAGDRTLVVTLARNAGVERPVQLLMHENISTPLLSGAISPAVLLPADAVEWSRVELQRALTHELEHVRRGDWLVHVVARGVCALYWFHPLVWMAWRRLALEAERSCDDAVLQYADQSEYAEQLVSLARRISGSAPQPLIAMAARSDLSTRISAVLDSSQARGRLRSFPAIAALIMTAGVTTAMTPVRVVSKFVTTNAVTTNAVVSTAKTPAQVDSTAVVTTAMKSIRAISDVAETPKIEVPVDSLVAITTAPTPVRVEPTDVRAPLRTRRVTKNVDCRSSLLRAAEKGNVETLITLLAQGAEVNCTEEGDGTPLIVAARRGHIPVVELLLTKGADPNLSSSGDGSPLIMAASRGHIDIVRLLLDRRADPNLGVPGDGNALIAAAGAGNIDIAQLLIDRGARIEDVVEGDENPLIHASEFGQIDMARFLIGRGANVNARVWVPPTESRGVGEWRSPLSMARRGGHDALVALLVNAGAKQ